MGSRRLASFVVFAACVVAQERTNGTCRIRARIVDENGRPIAGAGAVFGETEAITTSDALQRPAARSNAEGVLELVATAPGHVLTPTALLIAAPGRVAFRVPVAEGMWMRADVARAPMELGDVRLPAGHTLIGRVRDSAGNAIGGALLTGFDSFDPNARWCAAFVSSTRADADGVFVLPGVFAAGITLQVQAPGYFTSEIVGASLGTPLEVAMVTSGFVEGTATDADGAPMTGQLSCLYQLDVRPLAQ